MKYDFETVRDRSNSGSAKWLEMKKKNPQVERGIVPFSVADMEFVTAPEIVCGLQDAVGGLALGYTEPTDAYFEAVCGWMRRRHGWEVRPEWIETSPGVVIGLGLCVNAFTQPGDGVIVMPPVYYPFFLVAQNNGRVLVQNELINRGGRYEIDFEDLESKVRNPQNKMLLLCSPHNPVGRVWTKDELRQVGELCEKHGVLVVADEIHSDLVMPGYRHTVFSTAKEGFGSNSVILTAPSKTFNLAGMQASNIIIQEEGLREKFHAEKMKIGLIELNVLAYEACKAAYNNSAAWLEELISVLYKNSKLVESFVAKNLPDITVTPLEGTYLQWLDMRRLEMTDAELENRMTQEAQLFFDEGYIFGKGGSGFERINIACPQKVLEQGLERLYQVLR
ncbi:pyridoxal phosphate-dependent aminotransferase [Christensenellaceae bacterium OttesenSCG-928-K19]|nr:pyridoxal phosphate-dependent aminotransferase [Christensenellaceae bacterium OttesenSCG-928-K19]